MKFDAVILGSGLGGLECAYILAKNGKNVCVLEKNRTPGGCLQSFTRKGEEYDTGFHYVGALGKGQILEKIFSYLNLMDLPWHQLDTDGFDEIFLGDRSYRLCNGYREFSESLCKFFPASGKQLEAYSAFLEDVGRKITDPVTKQQDGFFSVNELLLKNAWEHLEANIQDPVLKNILSGNSLKLELKRETLPLYTFAQINSSFIQSAWKLKGSGSLIADSLVQSIRDMGGTVLTSAEVVEIAEEEGKADHVKVRHGNSEEQIFADILISDLSPELTLDLIKESRCIRPVFRHRISKLEQTYGFFTVNIRLKNETFPYFNRNFYCYSPDLDSVWDISDLSEKGCNQRRNR